MSDCKIHRRHILESGAEPHRDTKAAILDRVCRFAASGSLLIFSTLCIIATSAHATLRTGVGFGYWDFSAGQRSDTTWDFGPGETMVLNLDPDNALASVLLANSPARIAVMDATVTYEGLTEAPASAALYFSGIFFVPNRVWVVKTREGHYAKLQFLPEPYAPDEFEYTYQDDGTRSFVAPVAADQTTWGRVKALYR